MASSSSAKKVARVAAKSGSGSSAKKGASWLFPAAIVAILALGVGIVVFARSENGGTSDNNTAPKAQLAEGEAGDHWHAAFAVNVCGKELPAVQDGPLDPLGIHTHGDNLVHIHPFSIRAAGKRARMKVFFDQVSIKITDKGFELPDGKVYKEGETTCGGEPGQVVIAHWKQAVGATTKAPDKIFTDDFGNIPFSENYGAYTLAFEPKGTKDIPPPSSSEEIKTLGACDGANPPPECATGAAGGGATVPSGIPEGTPSESSGG